jgi:hypothetical protein
MATALALLPMCHCGFTALHDTTPVYIISTYCVRAWRAGMPPLLQGVRQSDRAAGTMAVISMCISKTFTSLIPGSRSPVHLPTDRPPHCAD